MLEKSPGKKVDKIKPEHLKEGINPILACVGTLWSFHNDGRMVSAIVDGKILNGQNVDFKGEPKELQKMGFENGGVDSYVISPVDHFDKYSEKFYDCTGLVVAGIERGTAQKISFMSHQNPAYFLNNDNSKFSEALKKQMRMIEDRCEKGTIDAVIFGGKYAKVKEFKESDPHRDIFIKEYLDSIKFLSKEVKDSIGFEPLVIVGPKTFPGGDYVFYDNGGRQLYIVRTEVDKDDMQKNEFDAAQSFLPSELEKVRKSWKPGEWGLPI